jgi:ATP-dependent Clp protease ATP-binding subunit ClpC
MFERYTEKARRVVFFARYEASQFGSPYIETEHLLLGLLREDNALTRRFLGSPGAAEAVRIEIEQHTKIREKITTSVDLPLSNEGKRVLAYSAEEAERLNQKHIGTEHLLLGLLREEKCFAAKLLHDRGVRLEQVREELGRFSHDPVSRESPKQLTLITQFCRAFIPAACQVQPLVGRENELDRLIYILCRFNKNNPALVGEPGVGKKTIIGGLIQRITEGTVPTILAGKSVLALDLSLVAATQQDRTWSDKFQKTLAAEGAIFFVDELHTPALRGESLIRIAEILKPLLMRGKIQCISTATPAGYAEAIENHRWLEQRFQAVEVATASEGDAIKVLLGIKGEYEKFHGVTYTEDALNYAVYYAHSCIRGGALPGKAVDVIDEAGASVGRHHIELPEEIVELQMRIKFIVHRMEGAIANHEFEKARFYSDEELKEREHLRLLREKYKLDETSPIPVTREHIEDVVARWTGASIASIRQALANARKRHP